jgi:hypothetical protein
MSKDEGKYVKARGLPWSASAEEVMEFFAGCEVVGGAEGVHFINNQAALWNRNRMNRNFLTSGTGTRTLTVTC